MSTKTSIKRIALVAVSALGFGLLSVMPAKAAVDAEMDTAELTAVSLVAASGNTYATGSAQTFTASATLGGTREAGDDFTLKAIITSQPGSSGVTITPVAGTPVTTAKIDPSGNPAALDTSNVVTMTNATHGLVNGDRVIVSDSTVTTTLNTGGECRTVTRTTANAFTYVESDVAADLADSVADTAIRYQYCAETVATAGVRASFAVEASSGSSPGGTADFVLANAANLATFAFTPSLAGSYTMTLWHDSNADNAITSGEAQTAVTITVTAAGVGTTEASAGSGESSTVNNVANTDSSPNDVVISKVALAYANTPRVGQETSVSATVSFYNNQASSALNFVTDKRVATIRYALSKPAGSASALSATSQVIASDDGSTAAQTAADTIGAAIAFTPDVAGTYTVTAWHDADGDGLQDNLEALGTRSVAVFADAADLTIRAFNSTADIGADEAGALIRIQITNGGAKASLAANESIKITASGATGSRIESVATAAGSTAVDSATYTLSSGQIDANGYAWINVSATAAGSTVVSFEGQGGTATSINKTQTITFVSAAAEWNGTPAVVNNLTGVREGAAFDQGAASGTYFVDQLEGTALSLNIGSATASTTAATARVRMVLTDTNGLVTGLANAVYVGAVSTSTTADKAVAVSFPALGYKANALTVAGNSYVVDFGADGGQTVTVTTENAVAETVTLDQADAIRVLNSSSVTLSAVIKDQFGVGKPNHAVTISHTAGDRNAQVAVTNAVTDASGRVSKTWTDAPLTGVTATTDSIVFDPSGNNQAGTTNNKTATITYVASLAVSKVVAYGGNTSSTGVTSATPTFNDIDADGGALTFGEGAEGGAKTLTAKVTDANGSVVVGVPVTWSVAGTGAEIATNQVTSYTNANGLATSSIYGWIKGTYTYTATAGGVSSTGTISFAQTAAGEERTITATVSGSLVTATVKDRFGNPVPLVKVWATKSGAGYFGNGLAKTDGTTDQNGEVSFTVAGADADVTVATYDKSDVTAKGSGQTCALAGNVDCAATAPTAFDAYVAGTATKGSTGVGASFAPAGVAEATVKVTGVQAAAQAATDAANAAADAAAEAIDAANAATDAANLAAEAADAATVAAEEARDAADAATAAVEELATQVATLMAALKAQITTLANTVAKIAKKVRA